MPKSCDTDTTIGARSARNNRQSIWGASQRAEGARGANLAPGAEAQPTCLPMGGSRGFREWFERANGLSCGPRARPATSSALGGESSAKLVQQQQQHQPPSSYLKRPPQGASEAPGRDSRCGDAASSKSAALVGLLRPKRDAKEEGRDLSGKRLAPAHGKLNREVESGKRMRDIITPVKYEPSEGDSLDGQSGDELAQHGDKLAFHRVASKGVAVLPTRPDLRKLTETRWQPPTNGRQYELKPAASSHNCPFETQLAGGERGAGKGACVKQATSSASLAARGGPSIVRHQASSSRRLLSQLARLRRLSEPNYRVKRPEKVAQVEQLIEQLERATVQWEEDELLLDRAERRDWPPEYHRRFSANPTKLAQSSPHSGPSALTARDFGRRRDINSLEEDTIARSHLNSNPSTARSLCMAPARGGEEPAANFRTPEEWRAPLGEKVTRLQPSALADRQKDDLAVRRLARSSTLRHLNQPADSAGQPNTSYLLLSSAYTPSIDTNNSTSFSESLDRRLHSDDLHYRQVRRKPQLHEPPFGIPRQQAAASAHSSASHYLRRQPEQMGEPKAPVCTCTCLLHASDSVAQFAPAQRRTDSKVSFVDPLGRVSADSGVAGVSPSSMGRQSAASRLTPASPICEQNSWPNRGEIRRESARRACQKQVQISPQESCEDDASQEVDLDAELRAGHLSQVEPDRWSNCESVVSVERHKAQLRVAPVKSRPKISLENPRSKSPLLRVSSKPATVDLPDVADTSTGQERGDCLVKVQCYGQQENPKRPPTSELECSYHFVDESDSADETPPASSRCIVTTTCPTSDFSPNESSIERLNYRTGSSKVESAEGKSGKSDEKGPSFSIGQYKPLSRLNLKIL